MKGINAWSIPSIFALLSILALEGYPVAEFIACGLVIGLVVIMWLVLWELAGSSPARRRMGYPEDECKWWKYTGID